MTIATIHSSIQDELSKMGMHSRYTYIPYYKVRTHMHITNQESVINSNLYLANRLHTYCMIAEQCERSEANNLSIRDSVIYIYIYNYIYHGISNIDIYILCYMSVCTCIAQDRVHIKPVLSRRPLCISTLAAVRSTTLRSRPFARYGCW